MSAQTTQFKLQMGALPEDFCPGNPQELANAIADRMTVVTESGIGTFVTGSVAPTSDQGPWFNEDTLEWNVWDQSIGAYRPMTFSGVASVPTGMILPWGGVFANVPTGYLPCDGSEYSITEYPALFAILGDGSMSDSCKFRVPDLRNFFLVGAQEDDANEAKSSVSDGATLLKSRVYTAHTHTGSITIPASNNEDGADPESGDAGTYPFTTSNESPRAIPPFYAVPFVIKT